MKEVAAVPLSRIWVLYGLGLMAAPHCLPASPLPLSALPSPILLQGSDTVAYRDPAAVYVNGVFHLFYTYNQSRGENQDVRMAVGASTSSDLIHWTPTRILTRIDPNLNFCSPGDVFRWHGEWRMCVTSYPRPNGEVYGNQNARIWLMRSPDLADWSEPEILRVKGPDVPRENIGRMIDPYIFEDRSDPGRWWCFFKQDGRIHRSWTRDFATWTPVQGTIAEGENACVVVKDGWYYLFSSPKNGIAVQRSKDLDHWEHLGLLTLGQDGWPWARGRITAGFVLDLRADPAVGRYLMFFHGTGPDPEPKVFDTRACIGIAWSDDLATWQWPGSGAGDGDFLGAKGKTAPLIMGN